MTYKTQACSQSSFFFGGGLRLACTTAEEVVVETSEDIHLSLSRTFPLLYGEIEPFVSQIRRHVGDLPRWCGSQRCRTAKKKKEHDSEGECVHTFVSVRVDEMQCCD